VAAGDINGDGWTDVVTGNTGNTQQGISIVLNSAPALNSPTGFPSSAVNIPTGGFLEDLALIDVTGDGIDDIIAHRQDPVVGGKLSIYTGNGNANTDNVSAYFTTPTREFNTGAAPAALAIGDVTGDGLPDIVVTRAFGADTLSVFVNQGQGNFSPLSSITMGPNLININNRMRLTDVNADGRLDVTMSSNLNGVLVMLGNGVGGFGSPIQFLGSGQFTIGFAAGDLNGDGRPELITANTNSSSLTVFQTSLPAATALVRTMTYDPVYSQLTSYTDERGHLTKYTLDSLGNTTEVRRVIGNVDGQGNTETDDVVTTITYTPSGQIDTVTDKLTDSLSRTTDYDYDPQTGLLSQVTFAKGTPDQATRHYFYDQNTAAGRAGMITSITDERGNTTQYSTTRSIARRRSLNPTDGPGTGLLLRKRSTTTTSTATSRRRPMPSSMSQTTPTTSWGEWSS
jgi:YD repeat-containing protein